MEQKLIHPILARFVGIYPQSWQVAPALRLEFLGCTFGEFLSFFFTAGWRIYSISKSEQSEGLKLAAINSTVTK